MFSVAPMMDWTDRHCRYLLRCLSPSAGLYTEMVTAAALEHGDSNKLLRYDPIEHPVALQVGGSDAAMMARAAMMAAAIGYDEININVGCPSDRVQSGRFGACLMASPDVVAECIVAMRAVCDIPITVKTRIGIDRDDDYDFLRRFVDATAAAGCTSFVIHARKAILQGLSPKENRSIPPLNYARVYQLKKDRPELRIVLNGGIETVADCQQHLKHIDGVMIGRKAYHHPWLLTELEGALGTGSAPVSRHDFIMEVLPYIENELCEGSQLKHITRHLLGLYAGQPGARAWRRHLSERAHRTTAGTEVLIAALDRLPAAA